MTDLHVGAIIHFTFMAMSLYSFYSYKNSNKSPEVDDECLGAGEEFSRTADYIIEEK